MDLRELPREPVARHPWERARYRFFREVLARRKNGRAPRVLDVGAGDAWFASRLVDDGAAAHVTCWDSGYDDPAAAGFRPQADEARLALTATRPSGRFDVVLLLDVLEHVEHDADFLGEVVRENLAPGGWLLASVPAWPRLYGRHDVALRHHRRYTPAQLRALVHAAGLELVEGGGLFHSLLLPRVAQNLRDRVRADEAEESGAPDTHWRGGELSARLVERVLRVDNRLSSLFARARLSVPGLTVWALCRHAHAR